MTPEEFEVHAKESMNAVFGVIAQSGDTYVLEKILTMIVAIGIGILRGLKGDQFVEDYLTAAIADKANRIEVETLPVN